ncbi:MAG: ATP-dependent zinc protease [Nanoarchaeota archaeon]|nr:ATP-dependent zinc protease [Nanoarchaeota archaeon]
MTKETKDSRYKKRIIIGLTENITIFNKSKNKQKKIKARIDTGAENSSMDARLAAELLLGPIIKMKLIKSAHGNKLRPVMNAEIKIANKNMKSGFTLADRSHLKYKVLIGQDILKHGFIIDPLKK